MRLTRCILICLFACGPANRVPPSTETPDFPPLPPESSSGIGLIRDRAADLALDPDQVAQLEALDKQLEELNRPLAAELDAIDRAAGQSAPGASGTGGRRRGGVSMSRGGKAAAPSAPSDPDQTSEEKQRMDELAQQERAVRQRMLNNDSSFVERALRLLRPDQRDRAMELLRKHGYGKSP